MKKRQFPDAVGKRERQNRADGAKKPLARGTTESIRFVKKTSLIRL